MLNSVLTRYPAWTRPARPDDAAHVNPPAKRAVGIAYSQLYSGGSVGRRNRSSIRFVIKKPPKMSIRQQGRGMQRPLRLLRLARNTDAAPSQWGIVSGRNPPPMTKRPPTPTRPDRAFVTAACVRMVGYSFGRTYT